MKIIPIKKWIPLVFLSLFFACQQESVFIDSIAADFTQLQNAKRNVFQEVGVFGGSGKQILTPVETHDLNYNLQDQSLQLEYKSGAYLKVLPAALGLPQVWKNVTSIELEIATEQDKDLLLELLGRRSRLPFHLNLKKGKHSYTIDTREIPLLGGLDNEVLQLNFRFEHSGRLAIHQLHLNRDSQNIFLVDQWGQRALVDYPQKINQDAQLFNLDQENQFLDSLSFSFSLDQYGGFSGHELPLEAKGYFHTQQLEEKWYLVTPLGNPFYSFGLNGVRRKSTLNNAALTRIRDRESLFEELPEYADCPECFSPDTAYLSFYCHNVKQKYPDYEAWKQQTARRFQQIGFNTVGNWSDSLFLQGPIPYTFTLDSRVLTDLLAAKHLPDVFHPAWESSLDSLFSYITTLADDPYLLGYFVDNEMPWGAFDKLDKTSFSHEVLSQYATFSEKQAAYAERYFSTIKRVLKKHDPNHLYLGCRFTRNLKVYQKAAEAAGNYVDVLSVNLYSPFTKKEMDAWYRTVNKPILIGEHHIPPQTEKALLPRYPAFSLEERDEMVRDYLQEWVSYPYAVGSHWYQYVDQEVAGRGDGGENQPVGLISVSDQLDRRLGLVFYEFAKTIPENYVK